MIKKLAKVLLGLILLLIIAAVLLLLTVNTEKNKAAIQAAVLSKTGYELTVAGDMGIQFFPSIGLTLNDVRLKNPTSPLELASTSALLLQVDLQALIDGQILIREFSSNDFHLNYHVDISGRSNWDIETSNGKPSTSGDAPQQGLPSSSESNTTADNTELVAVSFERLQLEDASIDIQDLSQGVRYSINNLDIVSTDTNIKGRPFKLEVNFDFLNNGMKKPMAMGFKSDVSADLDSSKISLHNINFNLTPMLVKGNVEISDFNNAVSYQGSLTSNNFDVKGLLQTIGLSEVKEDFIAANPMAVETQTPPLNFQFNFIGDKLGIEIPAFLVEIADTKIESKATVRFATDLAPTNISYEVVSNPIDLSPFIIGREQKQSGASYSTTTNPAIIPAAATDYVSATNNSSAADDVEIPAELLSSFNIIGSIAIESILVNELGFTNINVFTNVEDEVLDIEIQPISAFAGTMQGNIRLDGLKEIASLNSQLLIEQVDIVKLAPKASQLGFLTGNVDANIDYSATGNTVKAMQDSINGSADFAITENSIDISVIKQVFTAISALSPNGGTIEQWPDIIRFAELNGHILLENGISEGQQIQLRMDNFDLSGTGGINLDQGDFDYDLLFTILGKPALQTIKVDDLYHDVSWPVKCSAAFDDDASQYCRPDFTQVREIFSQIGTNAVKNQLEEIISEEVPEEIRSGVRGLLRSILN